MTRKHFKALAQALLKAKPETYEDGRAKWEQCVAEVADVCADLNPRFDRARFTNACGLRTS